MKRLHATTRGLGLWLGVILLLSANSGWCYHLITDTRNGGNPKLATREYKVYIGANARAKEAIAALDKVRAALNPRGVHLVLQRDKDGNLIDPPQQPIDRNRLNLEIDAFNKDPQQTDPPDPLKYPELSKYEAKKFSISIYWGSTADIRKRSTAADAAGLSENNWTLDDKGRASINEVADIFLPTNPPGGTQEVQNIMVHNTALHELLHTAGEDHYTQKQLDGGGEVMQLDVSLFDHRLNLGPQEIGKTGETEKTGAINSLYGPPGKTKASGKADKKSTGSLPPEIRNQLPTGTSTIWEYRYEVEWQEGPETSYVQIETGSAPIYVALGESAFDDWLFDWPEAGERYFETYADGGYLDFQHPLGQLTLYSPSAPGRGWLVSRDLAKLVPTPAPEPGIIALLLATAPWLIAWTKRYRKIEAG